MKNEFTMLNAKLVKIFNDVRLIEQSSLAQSSFSDLSLRDMHTIEAVSLKDNQTLSQIAKKMCLSPGSMTKIIDKLVVHDYVIRKPNHVDRRIINLSLTDKGNELSKAHLVFHNQMCFELTKDLTNSEYESVEHAIDNLILFLNKKSVDTIGGEVKK